MSEKTPTQSTSRFGLGQVNTADFLFDDESPEKTQAVKKTQTTSPDVKSYLQMMDTNDKFPILTQTGKVRAIPGTQCKQCFCEASKHPPRPSRLRPTLEGCVELHVRVHRPPLFDVCLQPAVPSHRASLCFRSFLPCLPSPPFFSSFLSSSSPLLPSFPISTHWPSCPATALLFHTFNFSVRIAIVADHAALCIINGS
jgi:hypothetical protein